MSPHPLVVQLRFTRSEWVRCLEGVTDAEARRRFMPMNCISWMVGHLADQEQNYWVLGPGGEPVAPDLHALTGYGRPASTPPLDEMWAGWRTVTATAGRFLETLAPADLQTHLVRDGRIRPESIGTMLQRNIYHYWFHTGQAYAIRQMLGHTGLPEFVGDMAEAGYRAEG